MNYADLIQNITTHIAPNGEQAITAQVLQDVLVDMVEEMGQTNDEDISLNSNNALQLADRIYDSLNPDGLGYVILRPGSTFAEQVTAANTVYEIRYDFDLDGGMVAIPAGCQLKFNGGSISNGTLKGNGTEVKGVYQFDSVLFDGSFTNDCLTIGSGFTGAVDFYGILRSFAEASIYLEKDITVTTKDVNTIPNLRLYGNGHTVKVVCLKCANTAEMQIENVFFDCSIAETPSGEGGFLHIMGNATNTVNVQGCVFNNLPALVPATYFRNVKNVYFERCDIIGTLDSSITAGTYGFGGVFLYNVPGRAKVCYNNISGVAGVAICALPGNYDSTNYEIKGNIIDNIGKGGVVVNGGILSNCVVEDNVITNTNQFQDANTAADRSAINFHGFKNIVISNNKINTPYSAGIDLTGTENGVADQITRGIGAVVSGNTVVAQSLSLMVVRDVTFCNNSVSLSAIFTITGYGIRVTNNDIIAKSGNSRAAIYIQSNASYTWDYDVYMEDCRITLTADSTSTNWIECRAGHGIINIDSVVANQSNGDRATYINPVDCLNFIDGFFTKIITVDLSQESRQMILDRSVQGFIKKDIKVYSIDGSISVSPAVTLGVGFARPSIANNDTRFGTITIYGAIGGTQITLSLDADKQNYYSVRGDMYLYCPGGGTGIITVAITAMTNYMVYF